MLEIEMSKDIKEYEPKIIGPLTARQIICCTLAASYGIPLFSALDIEIVSRVMITFFAMVPMVLCGWLKIYGLPLEAFIFMIIKTKLLRPQKRYYEISNTLDIDEEKVYYKKIKRNKNKKGYK